MPSEDSLAVAHGETGYLTKGERGSSGSAIGSTGSLSQGMIEQSGRTLSRR
jgi:hypothetical protein